jgi:putative transposase
MNPITRTILRTNVMNTLRDGGRPRTISVDYILDRIFFLLRTGCQWSNLPTNGCSWKTVYHYFKYWSDRNIFHQAFQDAVRFYVRRKGLSQSLLVDTSFVKNVYGRDCVGRSPVDRGRRATKLSILTDDKGVPLTLLFHPGNKSDCKTLEHLLSRASRTLKMANHTLHADRGYDTSACRSLVSCYSMKASIPKKRVQPVEVDTKRLVVEHTFSWFDKFRRIIMRYDGRVKHFRSFHFIASVYLVSLRV